MKPDNYFSSLSKRSIYLAYGIYLVLLAGIFLLSGEYLLRLNGSTPWTLTQVNVEVEPGGKFYTRHPTLGYTHMAGEFDVTLRGNHLMHVTHLGNTLRITRPLNLYDAPDFRKQIWIFGCSYTHGWELNDEETYPWQLQERLSNYEIVNFGTGGYGTLQSLIQFRQAIESGVTPKAVVLAYAGFHDARNTFLRGRRKRVAPYNNLGPLAHPTARIDSDGGLTVAMAEAEYSEFPLMRHSALVHFIERNYNMLEHLIYQSRNVAKTTVDEFIKLALSNNIGIVVAGISESPVTTDMLEYARGRGAKVIDISVDKHMPENWIAAHPSAVATKAYSDKLDLFLRTSVLK